MDIASGYKVVVLPFQGNKLFGEALDSLLVKTKGKCKMLPPKYRRSKANFKDFREAIEIQVEPNPQISHLWI